MTQKLSTSVSNLWLVLLVAATFGGQCRAQPAATPPQQTASQPKADSTSTPYINTGLNAELGVTTFVYTLAGGSINYNGINLLPEARLRFGFAQDLSVSLAAGYAGFTNLLTNTGSQQQSPAQPASYKPWTYSLAFGMDVRGNKFDWKGVGGIHQFVFGVGRGNFQIASNPDNYKKGNYFFVGFTADLDSMVFHAKGSEHWFDQGPK